MNQSLRHPKVIPRWSVQWLIVSWSETPKTRSWRPSSCLMMMSREGSVWGTSGGWLENLGRTSAMRSCAAWSTNSTLMETEKVSYRASVHLRSNRVRVVTEQSWETCVPDLQSIKRSSSPLWQQTPDEQFLMSLIFHKTWRSPASVHGGESSVQVVRASSKGSNADYQFLVTLGVSPKGVESGSTLLFSQWWR